MKTFYAYSRESLGEKDSPFIILRVGGIEPAEVEQVGFQ